MRPLRKMDLLWACESYQIQLYLSTRCSALRKTPGQCHNTPMPAIKFSLPHQLSHQDARSKVRRLFPELRQKYGQYIEDASESWSGDHCDFRLRILGMNATGRLDVLANRVDIELDLPWAAMMFKDKIQQTIQDRGKLLLQAGK
jgi:hypothetical protein